MGKLCFCLFSFKKKVGAVSRQSTVHFFFFSMSSLHVSAQCLHARVPTWACETAVCVTIEAAARASAENRRLPLDVVLVLDRSSSMSGAKIELCKATVSFVLDEMRLCDRIALVSYGSDVRDEFGGLVAVAPDARRRCKGVVAQLRPGKRTNLSGGVLEGLEILRSAAARSEPAEGEPSRRSASLLLLTDGHANHGVVDTDKVLALVRSQLSDWSFSSLGAGGGSGGSSEGVRIFTFGYGVDHNARLLRALSDESGGLYYYVPSIDAVPVAFGDCLGGLLTVGSAELAATRRRASRRPRARRARCASCCAVGRCRHRDRRRRRDDRRAHDPRRRHDRRTACGRHRRRRARCRSGGGGGWNERRRRRRRKRRRGRAAYDRRRGALRRCAARAHGDRRRCGRAAPSRGVARSVAPPCRRQRQRRRRPIRASQHLRLACR